MPTSSLGPRCTSLCSTDAAGPYPSTPSTPMGAFWAEAAAADHITSPGGPDLRRARGRARRRRRHRRHKAFLSAHAGRDDYHCIEDTGFIELFGKNAQAAADLNIIAHWIAEPRACR